MNKKSVIQFLVAFGLLAALLIYLGVNYVPRSYASSSTKESAFNAARYAGSDYFERHPFGASQINMYAGSDWIERHPSNFYTNSDWIERDSFQQIVK